MTLADYQAIGMKSGLEIHQQLDTEKKLFCRCPILPYSEKVDAQILRHMRPTLSELGEYDGTALMEFKTKKNIIYQINTETVCTYEMDDTPPFELNEQALDIALEITMLLGCKLVSEIHIARKQYLDGSIPTGFQRTTILGVDGSIPYGDRRIGIIQLGLEEDACREITDIGHDRVYRTDRLGIPLIETVTYPEMRTPQEVADVAQVIRQLTRSTGKVRTGIGRTRQDVNVSVTGGHRVEIKGVPRIPMIPLLVHNEAFRQLALLEIRDRLNKKGITEETFKYDTVPVTDVLKGTQYYPVMKAIKDGLEVHAVVLRGFRGILPTKTQPETTFSKEISDRVRVVACLDILPNIAHTDSEGETFSSAEWTKIKKHSKMKDDDVVVVVWGNEEDSKMGISEIALRAKEAAIGVPDETRQALADGTNGFERILPGPNRMYPDTDLPPLAITDERIERIRSALSELPWDRQKRYEEMGLDPETARRMSISKRRDAFDRAVSNTKFAPPAVAGLLLDGMRRLRRRDGVKECSDGVFVDTLAEAGKKKLPDMSLEVLLKKTCGPEGIEPARAAAAFELLDKKTLEKKMKEFAASLELPDIEKEKLVRYLTGQLAVQFRGYITGREAFDFAGRFVASE
jgi:glutamyl-tRNA(Gln) amidotransferase subunit E